MKRVEIDHALIKKKDPKNRWKSCTQIFCTKEELFCMFTDIVGNVHAPLQTDENSE